MRCLTKESKCVWISTIFLLIEKVELKYDFLVWLVGVALFSCYCVYLLSLVWILNRLRLSTR
uniref:Putative ovule protein n=1 Tax=Solanum chacoense TaxID=4108 RepID=A0A0V0H6S4_SOLCH